MKDPDEILEIVDACGNVLGSARRRELHGNPALIHRVVHVLVFDGNGRLLLQKRSLFKDVAPGKWDTSVGGHVNPGETGFDAARREMREELGIDVNSLDYLYDYLYSNHTESELVSTFSYLHEGKLSEIPFSRSEIDEVRLWDLNNIKELLGSGIFSSQFEKEFMQYTQNKRTGRF